MKKLLLVLVLFPVVLFSQRTLSSMNVFYDKIEYVSLGYECSMEGEYLLGDHVGNGMCYDLVYAVQDSLRLKEDSVAKHYGYESAELGYYPLFIKGWNKSDDYLLQVDKDNNLMGCVILYTKKREEFGHILIIDQESITGAGVVTTEQNIHGLRAKKEYVDNDYIKSLFDLMKKCDNFVILEPIMKLTNKIN